MSDDQHLDPDGFELTDAADRWPPPEPDVPDVVAWLRDHPEDWEFATADDFFDANPDAKRLLAEVYRRAAKRRARRRRRWIGAGGLVAVLGAGSLAYALWPSEQVSNPTGVLCHAQSDAEGDRAGIEFVDDPVAACAVLWSDGTFATDGPPPLVGCVNDAGLATVLPGEPGVCAALGWPDLEPGLSAETEAVAALNARVIDEINAQPCQPADEVLAAAGLVLAESGLEGWTVVIGEGWDGAECAKVAVDPLSRSLTVVGF